MATLWHGMRSDQTTTTSIDVRADQEDHRESINYQKLFDKKTIDNLKKFIGIFLAWRHWYWRMCDILSTNENYARDKQSEISVLRENDGMEEDTAFTMEEAYA